MKRLPYAPRPIRGEGLASWTARLAVHNFVTPAAFYAWLGILAPADVSHGGEAVGELARVAGLPVEAVIELVRASPNCGQSWKSGVSTFGLQGGACPVCCREAADAGRDHWWPAESEALLRVSCPRHHCGLVGLEHLELVRKAAGLRLMLPSDVPLGAQRRSEPLSESVLKMEALLTACAAGRRPGNSWRLESPGALLRSVDVLAEYVHCSPIDELPFAHAFDPLPHTGGDVFRISAASQRRGVLALLGQPARTRRNTLAALYALLGRPATLACDVAEGRRWRTAADGEGPYRLLVESLGRPGRGRLEADLPNLPPMIASSVVAALAACALERGPFGAPNR